jgi:acyl-CoA thioesterase FadM
MKPRSDREPSREPREMTPIFSVQVPIRFRDADLAGISFFGRVYGFAHDAFEDFVGHLGFEWNSWFNNEDWGLPIRHSECDYLMPLLPSEKYQIQVLVERISKSSFTLRYLFSNVNNTERINCEVRLVHTFYDKKARTKMSIPSDIHDRLESYQSECLSAK